MAGAAWRFIVVLLTAACGGESQRGMEPPAKESAPTPEPEPEPEPGMECRSNADCAVVAPCCSACGALRAEEAIPLRRDEARAFREACGSSGSVPCSACVRGSNPYLVPVCEQGLCRVFDLASAPATACENGDDCALRAKECCADDTTAFISVNAAALGELDAILCDGEPEPMSCRVMPPMHQAAVCREGRCSSAFFDL